MSSLTIADKQRVSYAELLNNIIPQYLKDASYVKDGRYSVDFSLYPIDSVNTIEENGFIYTIIKTFCRLEDLETGEVQELIIDLLKVPVFQELGFMVAGNYKQVLDTYDKPAGWAFFKKPAYEGDNLYYVNTAKLTSANYKTLVFESDKQAPFVKCNKNYRAKTDKDPSKVPVSIFFRALTGYTNAELLEIFGYDNPYNTLVFGDNPNMAISGKQSAKVCNTRAECIEYFYSCLFGSQKAQDKNLEEKLNQVNNWFFKQSYMNLGTGNRKRFEYIQSFKNRALNKVLAEDVALADRVLKAGSVLTAAILTEIDNSPIDCIRVEYDNKIHSLHKFSTFTFRALGYYLAENVTIGNTNYRAGTQLTLNELSKLNESNLSTIAVWKKRAANQPVITLTRNASGSVLTIDDIMTAYSIFANNLNGYDYVSDIDELTDKIVVPLDKKVLNCLESNLTAFINVLNNKLGIVGAAGNDRHIINALSDFSTVIDKNCLLDELRDVKRTESQLSDINNVISFVAKDFKVTNQMKGNNATDDLISVHGLQFGRLDPYDSPESNKIGKVHHRTMLAKEDENGYILAPYVRVVNGVITDEEVYLSATEEKDLYIAEWCETFVDENGEKKKRVRVRYKGEIVNVDTDMVLYKESSPLQILSPTTGCIPFVNFAAGKRVQMSDNQQKQAVSVAKTERPLVCTGTESLLGAGVYKAKDVIASYYNDNLYSCPEIQNFKEQIENSGIQLTNITSSNGMRKLHFTVLAAAELDIEDLPEETFLEIPFGQHTLKSDMFSYRVNASTGGYFIGDDIVAYNTAYDMRKYNIGGLMDYGSLDVSENMLQGSLALGHNYCVAFKTMESSSIDDGIVISSAIVADDTITSIMIHKETVELMKSETETESFEAPSVDSTNSESIDYFNPNGLPKIGTYLSPGDVVAYKKVTKESSDSRGGNRKGNFRATKLGMYTEGQVVHAEIVKKSNGTVAEIYLACRASGEVADKFAGRIGNKGVVAKIIPEEMMPYDPVTGRTVDFILNPLGVPSRMNITQLLEVTLAAAASKNNEVAIVSPFHPDSLNFVMESAEKAGVKPIKLIDGRTGKPFEREINVGYQYMYKLVHMARKNIHAVGLQHGVNAMTLQAKSSSKLKGGQSFGEMESWCLESIGAMKVLQELHTVMSDDHIARKALERSYKSNPYKVEIVGENHNDVMMTTLLRLLGTNVITGTDEQGEIYYEFQPLRDETIRAFSNNSVSDKGALHSIDIFGANNDKLRKMTDRHKWGWINLHTEIIHPTWLEKSDLGKMFLLRKCMTRPFTSDKEISWANISLCPASILQKIRDREIFVRCADDVLEYLSILNQDQFDNLDEQSKLLYKTGFDALSYVFRHYDLKKSLTHLEMLIMDRKSAKASSELTVSEVVAFQKTKSLALARHNSFEKFLNDLTVDENDASSVYENYDRLHTTYQRIAIYSAINDFIKSGAKLTDFLISSYPVMPAIYRPNKEIRGKKQNDFDAHYGFIINAALSAKNVNAELAKMNVYNAIKNFIGLSKGKNNYVTVLEWFVGKNQSSSNAKNHGKIRETVQKKIIGRSGRSVIIPSADPSRGPMYLGLPFSMAVAMYEEQLVPYLTKYIVDNSDEVKLTVADFKKLFLAIASNDAARFNKIYCEKFLRQYAIPATRARKQFIEWITQFIEGSKGKPVGPAGEVLEPQVVISGRQPSLHRYSIRAYYPVIVFTRAMQMHPLVCSGYNADFDGDQMWVAALISEDAKEEAIALMSARADVINPKNGDIVLTHSQDIALGTYVMTMLKDNALEIEDKSVKHYYTSVELLYDDLLQGEIHPYEIVSLSVDGKHFVSTAGRLAFNSILPYGFSAETGTFTNKWGLNISKPERFAELQYDGLITSGKGADDYKTYSLSKICMDLYEGVLANKYDVDFMLDIFQRISETGFRMSDRYGVSISIFDFRDIANKSNKKRILLDAETLQKQLEMDYQDGLLSDADKAACINKIYSKAFADVEKDIFGDKESGKPAIIDRNNNIFIMFDSGARGSKSQIMQAIGAVGNLQKTKTENLELPVLSNYSEGLSSFDFQMLAYSTRTGMASTQNETANSGYASRRAEHCVSGIEISELDCGKQNWWYHIEWGNRIDSLSSFTPNEKWFRNNLLGRNIKSDDMKTAELFAGTLNGLTITEKSFECLTNGFNTISLEDGVISVSPEMLVGSAVLDEGSLKYLNKFTKSGYLTRDALKIINDRHLKSITTDIGRFEFRYKLSDLSRSLLNNREGRNMPGLIKYQGPLSRRLRSDMHVITAETLDWIEKSGTETIEARILLDCESGKNDCGAANKTLHGVCARCYGLKYTSNTLPEIGENVGIESAQAIGEPAAQLTLSLVNKGGSAGESVASGVDILHKILNGSNMYTDQKHTTTLVAQHSGYLQIEQLDKKVKLTLQTETGEILDTKDFMQEHDNVRIDPKNLIRKNGEWVNAGEALTSGFILPENIIRIPENTTEALIRAKQITWLYNWFKTFADSKIFINARHFEIFTRAQMCNMVIRYSDNPAYEVGKKYKVSDVLAASGHVYGTLEINKCKETILNSSGALAVLSYEDIMGSLPGMAIGHHRSYKNSPTGALNLGEDVRTKTKKQLYDYDTASNEFSEEVNEYAELEFTEELAAMPDTTSMQLFDAIMNLDFSEESAEDMELFNETSSEDLLGILDDEVIESDSSGTGEEELKPIEVDSNLINVKEMDFFSKTENTVKFSILDSLSYEPYQDVDLVLMQDGVIKYNATTDFGGSAVFPSVSLGRYELKILSELYTGETAKEINVTANSQVDDLLLISLLETSSSSEDSDDDDTQFEDEEDSYGYEEYDEEEDDDANYDKFMASYKKKSSSVNRMDTF